MIATFNRPNDQVLQGDLRDHLPAILNSASDAALFAFLDPFGTALDRSQLVDELLGRQSVGPVEVLLHISVSTVARLGGLLRSRRLDGIELSEADCKTIDHVNRFLGGDWWQAHFEPVRDSEDQERATDAALRVAAEYMDGVCQETGYQAVRMPIRAKPTPQGATSRRTPDRTSVGHHRAGTSSTPCSSTGRPAPGRSSCRSPQTRDRSRSSGSTSTRSTRSVICPPSAHPLSLKETAPHQGRTRRSHHRTNQPGSDSPTGQPSWKTSGGQAC